MAYSQDLIKRTLMRSLKTVETIRPGSRQKFANVLYKLWTDYGVLMLFYSGARDYAEQWKKRLSFLQGTGGQAASPGWSWHNFNRAIDAAPVMPDGTLNWKSDKWPLIGKVITEQGLTWGGSFGDKPHMSDQQGTTLELERSKLPGWQPYKALETQMKKPGQVSPKDKFIPNPLGWLVIGSLVAWGSYAIYKELKE